MPDHHEEEEIYFGEDYYDENAEDSQDASISDDPYAEATRLAKMSKKNDYITYQQSDDSS